MILRHLRNLLRTSSSSNEAQETLQDSSKTIFKIFNFHTKIIKLRSWSWERTRLLEPYTILLFINHKKEVKQPNHFDIVRI